MRVSLMPNIQFFLNNDQIEALKQASLMGESLPGCAKRLLLSSLDGDVETEAHPECQNTQQNNATDFQAIVDSAIARLIGDKIRPLEIRVEMLNHQLGQLKIVEAPNEAIEQSIEYLSSNALSKKLGVSKTTVLRWKKKSTISPDGKWEYDADKQGWRTLD